MRRVIALSFLFIGFCLGVAAQEDYASSLNNAGARYHENGEYAKAELLYLRALQINKIALGENHPDYALSLNNLGLLYNDIGDYTKAEQYYLQAYNVYSNAPEENLAEYASLLNNLGNLYKNTGDYSKAEQYYLQSLELVKTTLGENQAAYASSLNNLGNLYRNIGDYSKAEQCFLQSLEIVKFVLGEKHPDYASLLNNLGNLYRNSKDYPKAKQCYLQALAIIKDTLGENHAAYASSLNNLGLLYGDIGDYSNAEQCYLQASNISKITLGENHPNYATSLDNLGNLYRANRNQPKAEQCYLQSLEIIKTALGENHPDYAFVLNDIGILYGNAGDYSKAEDYLLRAQAVSKSCFVQSLNYMSEQQRNSYWNTIKNKYESVYPEFVYRYQPQKPTISSFAYNNELFTKGLLLNSSNAIRFSITESVDTALIRQWNELTTIKQKMIVMEEKNPQSQYLEQLRKEAEQLEKSITRSSAAYRENLRQWNISWDSVRAVLKPKQVAIEFMKVPLNMDSTMYCALLLRDTCSYPLMIPLFEENQVAGLAGVSLSSAIKQVYDYNGYGMQLSQIVWSKIQKYINRGDEVFFAPTGVLYQLAIENLPFDENHTMSDVYNMVRLSSTREIVLQPGKKKYKTAALYGDINYNLRDTSVMLANADRYRDMAKISIVGLSGDTVQRSMASNLPGTKKEIDTIQPILQKKKIDVTVYAWDNACEESFKALTGKHPSILHIATHGFFWDDAKAKKEQYFRQRGGVNQENRSIDPLDRCGLLFTGANVALSGHSKTLPEGVDDGILTAKEISNLDFRTTDIVVLSACETGLGDITGDGVFGLQRAFKMAGAQTILMSLWRVDDDATQLLMAAFYRHLSQGQSKRRAFRNAQQEVRNYTVTEPQTSAPTVTKTKSKDKSKSSASETILETITTQPYTSPYFWAGFILLD